MKLKFKILTVIILQLLFCSLNLSAQQSVFQKMRGKIVDEYSKFPLINASIVLESGKNVYVTSSNEFGNFSFDKIPVGRYNINISFVGYQSSIIAEVLVSAGKEVVLEIGLKEQSQKINEVIVMANSSKDQPINSMASVSVRTFNVEEANRYAGGFDDPARLASAFAGVASTQTTNNSIIIRGNSPRGVLWRVEGIDVPTTAHFPNVDFVGGGAYTIFSSQMLRNSDFFTGAFPAEYSNANSGVFDVKLRSGNSDKREYLFGVGLHGIDFSSEGPFSKNGNATYIFNYRYGTLGLLGKIASLPSIPTYQDITFKLDFPIKKIGTISLFGMGADDTNKKEAKENIEEWTSSISGMNQNYKNRFYTLGLSHKLSIGSKTYINSILSIDNLNWDINTSEYNINMQMLPTNYMRSSEGKFTIKTTVNHRFNSKVTSRTGVVVNSLYFDNKIQKAIVEKGDDLQTIVDSKGKGLLVQAFTQYKINITPKFISNIGVNAMYLSVNKDFVIEPRVSINWFCSDKNELSLAYGMHSQMEELRTYYSKELLTNNNELPNKNIGFMKSHHFVLGFNRKINTVTRLKVETYYQILTDIPVYSDGSFSIINTTSDWLIDNKLFNNGIGCNYGVDITFERFLKDNYYYLITGTFYNSKYKGADGVERNTTFNRNYVVNFLAGKEWMIKGKNILSASVKLTYMGGLRYTPALYNESINKKRVILDDSKAFENQFPSTIGLDFSINYKINKKRSTRTWYIMMKNALIQPDYTNPFYDRLKNDIVLDEMKMPFPSFGYKIEF